MKEVPLVRETVNDLMTRNASVRPYSTAFIFEGREFTWKEVDEISDRIAIQMLQRGIKKGTHVGFWSLNDIDLVLALIAVMKIGAVPAVVNYSYRTYELKGVVWRAKIECLYIGEEKKGSDYWDMAETIQAEEPVLREIYDLHADVQGVERTYRAGVAPSDDEFADLEEKKAAVDTDDVACITFTSGTTKTPKPVMLSFYNIINDVRQFEARMRVTHDDVLFAALPLFHSSGIAGLLFNSLVAGVPAVVNTMFHAEKALKDIELYQVTVLMVIPSMAELMVLSKEFPKRDISSLRVGLMSGAVVSPLKMRKIIGKLQLNHLLMAYGQTECSPIVSTTLYDDDLKTATETVGKPIPHIEVRIWDNETDREAPLGETGEIQVRGFNTMKGYYNYGTENVKKYTDDGWLKTTDAGYFDDQGYLYFATRISAKIIRHGENISPAEIEAVVEQFSDDIIEVKVVGVPEELVGEEIACLVQTKSERIDPDRLRAFVKQTLASFKCPKYVFQVDAFPMTETAKINEAAVKQLARNLVDELEEKDE